MKYRTKEVVNELRATPAATEQLENLSGGVTRVMQHQISRVRDAIGRATTRLPQFSLFRGSSYAIPSSNAVPNEEVSQELSTMRRQLSRENLRQAEHRSEEHIQSPW